MSQSKDKQVIPTASPHLAPSSLSTLYRTLTSRPTIVTPSESSKSTASPISTPDSHSTVTQIISIASDERPKSVRKVSTNESFGSVSSTISSTPTSDSTKTEIRPIDEPQDSENFSLPKEKSTLAFEKREHSLKKLYQQNKEYKHNQISALRDESEKFIKEKDYYSAIESFNTLRKYKALKFSDYSILANVFEQLSLLERDKKNTAAQREYSQQAQRAERISRLASSYTSQSEEDRYKYKPPAYRFSHYIHKGLIKFEKAIQTLSRSNLFEQRIIEIQTMLEVFIQAHTNLINTCNNYLGAEDDHRNISEMIEFLYFKQLEIVKDVYNILYSHKRSIKLISLKLEAELRLITSISLKNIHYLTPILNTFSLNKENIKNHLRTMMNDAWRQDKLHTSDIFYSCFNSINSSTSSHATVPSKHRENKYPYSSYPVEIPSMPFLSSDLRRESSGVSGITYDKTSDEEQLPAANQGNRLTQEVTLDEVKHAYRRQA